MRFDDTFIEQVRNGISIVDLVGGYVRLQRQGLRGALSLSQ